MTEREIVNALRDAGIPAEKVSRTGYTGEDLLICDEFKAESKHRQNGWPTLAKWINNVDILFLRKQGNPNPMVVMRMDLLIRLLLERREP